MRPCKIYPRCLFKLKGVLKREGTVTSVTLRLQEMGHLPNHCESIKQIVYYIYTYVNERLDLSLINSETSLALSTTQLEKKVNLIIMHVLKVLLII